MVSEHRIQQYNINLNKMSFHLWPMTSSSVCQLHYPQYGFGMSTPTGRTKKPEPNLYDANSIFRCNDGLGGIWLIINPSIAPSLLCELLLVIAEATTCELHKKRPPHIRRRVISLLVFNLTMLFTRDSNFIHIHFETSQPSCPWKVLWVWGHRWEDDKASTLPT